MILSTILVALDGTALAEQALPYAEELAKRSGAEVLLTRVLREDPAMTAAPDDEERGEFAEAQAYLHGIAASLDARGLRVLTVMPGGKPSEAIVEQGAANHVDLIVMATQVRSGLGRLFFGSVTEQVLGDSPIPLLLVHARDDRPAPAVAFPDRPRLLIPLDGSPEAEVALPVAARFAQLLGGALTLLRVLPPPPPPVALDGEMTTLSTPYLELYDEEKLRLDAQEYLDRAQRRLDAGADQAESVVRSGPVVETIVATLTDIGAALIVMAAHPREGFERLIVGSTPIDTLREIDLPMLLVRTTPMLSPIEEPRPVFALETGGLIAG